MGKMHINKAKKKTTIPFKRLQIRKTKTRKGNKVYQEILREPKDKEKIQFSCVLLLLVVEIVRLAVLPATEMTLGFFQV